ncbi:MAG: hypothetical protein AB1Z22_10980, partial [Synechococcaceae cyanobacterium]
SRLVVVRFEQTARATVVRAVVRGPTPPSPAQVAAMEEQLPATPDGLPLALRLRFVHLHIVDRHGLLNSDAELGYEE